MHRLAGRHDKANFGANLQKSGGLAFPKGDEHEDNRDDGQSEMTQGCMRLREQVIGLGLAGDQAGEGGKKQHVLRVMAPTDKNVIRITSSSW